MKSEKKIWGLNFKGELLKEGDKIKCGNGISTWFTHVQWDEEKNCWHRELDYRMGVLVGTYN